MGRPRIRSLAASYPKKSLLTKTKMQLSVS